MGGHIAEGAVHAPLPQQLHNLDAHHGGPHHHGGLYVPPLQTGAEAAGVVHGAHGIGAGAVLPVHGRYKGPRAGGDQQLVVDRRVPGLAAHLHVRRGDQGDASGVYGQAQVPGYVLQGAEGTARLLGQPARGHVGGEHGVLRCAARVGIDVDLAVEAVLPQGPGAVVARAAEAHDGVSLHKITLLLCRFSARGEAERRPHCRAAARTQVCRIRAGTARPGPRRPGWRVRAGRTTGRPGCWSPPARRSPAPAWGCRPQHPGPCS